jgi:hypothetical protein
MFGKTTPIYGGYHRGRPYIYAQYSSILRDELQLYEGKINLKIGRFSICGRVGGQAKKGEKMFEIAVIQGKRDEKSGN